MMNVDHGLSGLVGGLGLGVAVQVLRPFGIDPSPADIAALAVCCAGAAIVPDLDHPDSVPAHSLGFLTAGFRLHPLGFLRLRPLCWIPGARALGQWRLRVWGLAHLVAKASGGHRWGTHSALGVALVLAVYTLLAVIGSWAAVAGAGILLGLAAALVRPHRGLIRSLARFGFAAAFMWALVPHTTGWWWLPPAAGLGAYLHCLGDRLTPPGVPWWWPVSRRRYGARVFTTDRDGARWPTVLLRLGMWATLAALIWVAVLPAIPAAA